MTNERSGNTALQYERRTPSNCFSCLMLTGIGLVIIGLILVPVLPHIQLDAVLTSAELADDSKRSETLALLQKASGNGWLITTGLGVFIFVVSFVGYRSVVRISHTPRQFPENKSDLP